MGLLLTPYNDSMRLGQGYNSFLQRPGVYNAVTIPAPPLQRVRPSLNTSQAVSYSSHVVNKISDITRSMGISTGSSIKNGSISLSANSSSINESKLAESDMNVIISVKVVNQSPDPESNQTAEFNTKGASATIKEGNNEKFHKTYGDCYISGFIEGGDLHGVVSLKVLDSTRKEEIKAKILGDLNSSGPTSFSFDPSRYTGTAKSELNQCETTIAVNWSGGGAIKEDDEEWSIESLYRVAAAFPANVAVCPRRTWAILTPYSNNAGFIKWAASNKIVPYDYSGVELYASDLLDTYMGYKKNIRRIQAILSDPKGFTLGPATDRISITVKDLVSVRNDMKLEMATIIDEIDELNEHPEKLDDVLANSKISPPELWEIKLPVSVGLSAQEREALEWFSLLDSEISLAKPEDTIPGGGDHGSPLDPPTDKLYTGDAAARLTEAERKALGADLNRRILARYRFDATPIASNPAASGTATEWTELKDEIRMNAVFAGKNSWPRTVYMNMTNKNDIPVFTFKLLFSPELGMAGGDITTLTDGTEVLTLAQGERIHAVRIAKSTISGKEVISYIKINTTGGQEMWVGLPPKLKNNMVGFSPPEGCRGLAFFQATAKDKHTGAVGRLILAWK